MAQLTAFLRDFHARFPGCTSRAFADGDCGDGRSSYDRLVSLVVTAEPGTVLDLACGDGYLLQALALALPATTDLIGCDVSPDELALAAVRLQERCRLVEAGADRLPLATASVDVVTCHMALMLIDPLAPALAEMARILRPGGRLLAVVSGAKVSGDAYEVFLDGLGAVPDLADRGPRFGDPSVRMAEGWQVALDTVGFCDVAIEPLPVTFHRTPEAAWAWLTETYTLALLTEAERDAMKAAFLAAVRPTIDGDGWVRLTSGLRLIKAQRP